MNIWALTRLLGIGWTTLFLCSIAGSAAAEIEGDALASTRVHDTRAEDFFEAEDYDRALEEMELAQEIAPSTVRLYNMAVCNERLGRIVPALELYRIFVVAGDAPAARLGRAREALARLETAQRAAEVRRAEELASASSNAEEPGDGDTPHDEVGGAGRRRLAPPVFFVSLGVTLASAVAWAVVAGVTLSRHNDYVEWADQDSAPSRAALNVIEARDKGHALALGADVLLGLTAAAALTTAILAFLTRWSGDEGGEGATLTPFVTASGGGLDLVRHF